MAWCGSQSFEHVQNHTSFHEFYRGLTGCHDLFYTTNVKNMHLHDLNIISRVELI